MQKLFGAIEGVFIYIEALLLATKDEETHYRSLSKIFKVINGNKINVNWKKCLFNTCSISFLGQIIKNNIIKADLTDLNTTRLNNEPKNFKHLRSLIGYINYFRNYIPKIAELLFPLTEKLKTKN